MTAQIIQLPQPKHFIRVQAKVQPEGARIVCNGCIARMSRALCHVLSKDCTEPENIDRVFVMIEDRRSTELVRGLQ